MILGEAKARPKDIISFSLDYISKSKVQTSNPSSSPIPLDTPARPADFGVSMLNFFGNFGIQLKVSSLNILPEATTLPETNSEFSLKIGRNPKGKSHFSKHPFSAGFNSLALFQGNVTARFPQTWRAFILPFLESWFLKPGVSENSRQLFGVS